jgi:hypothetical protein
MARTEVSSPEICLATCECERSKLYHSEIGSYGGKILPCLAKEGRDKGAVPSRVERARKAGPAANPFAMPSADPLGLNPQVLPIAFVSRSLLVVVAVF